MSLLGSLAYGAANVFHPRMLWLMAWPMLASLAAWGAAAYFYWTPAADWLAGLAPGWLGELPSRIAANVVVLLVFVPLVWVTALFLLGVFGMQKMVEFVAERSFPGLARRHGGGVAGSVWNGVVALAGMAALFAATVPLWLLPFLWPFIPLAVMAWVNQRLLRYDALAEHADREEMGRLFRERRGPLYLLGVLLGVAAFVPVVGFLAPLAFGLATTHYLLGELASLRQEGVGNVRR